MIIEVKKISELKPAPYNARISTKKQEGHLKKSLEKFGIVEPIVFNKRSGYIVGGHFRVRELKKLGYKEVHCVVVDLNDQDERELNIRLNANTGEYDWDKIANQWEAEQVKEWGLPIPWEDVSQLEQDDQGSNEFTRLEVECKDPEQLNDLMDELHSRGYNVKAK